PGDRRAGPPAKDDNQGPPGPSPAPKQAMLKLRAKTAAAASRSARPSPSGVKRSCIRVWLLAAAAIVVAGGTTPAISLSGGGGRKPRAPSAQSHGSQQASSPAVSRHITGSLAATLKNPKYAPIAVAVAFGPGGRTLAVGSANLNSTHAVTYLWDTA